MTDAHVDTLAQLDDVGRVTHDAQDEKQGSHVREGEAAAGSGKAPSQAQPAQLASKPQQTASLPWAWVLLSGGLAAGALLLLRRLRQQRKSGGKAQPVQVPQEQVFSVLLRLAAPPQAQPATAPRPLAGRTLVVSDRLDVAGVQTRFGSDVWQSGRQPSKGSHTAVGALLAAGAEAVAVVPSECMGLGPLLSGAPDAAVPNPAGRGHSNGGGDFGAAVAVAAGHADLALAVDELGSARVPAACCGMYAFRPTAGVVSVEGASTASHSLAAPAVIAKDAHTLLRAGEALRLPGGGSRGDVASYLVAEDYFSECGPRMRSMVPAIISAVKRWAGPDQAQGLSLCEWLYHRIGGLRQFMEEGEGANGNSGQPDVPVRHTRGVLCALASAAEAVRQWEYGQTYEEWVSSAASGGGGGGTLPQEAVRFQEQAQQVGEERYRAAQDVMAELSDSMRFALREGYIFVLPTTPGEAPPTGGSGGESEQREAFRQQALQFSSLAALAGVPQVTLPLPVPGQLPLSISLMSLHKKDLTLLQAVAKLGPILAEEAAKLAAEQAQQAQQQRQQRRQGRGAGGGAAEEGAASADAPSQQAAAGLAGGRKGSKKKAGQGGDEEQKARAEACKEDGNAAFKGGKLEEAVRHYSLAVQLDPKNHVYYANRALAYLKLGLYGAAEADCDAALQLDLNVKALLRRGSARVAQGNAEGAKADFQQVLALEPQNRQAREELRAIQQMEEQLLPGAY